MRISTCSSYVNYFWGVIDVYMDDAIGLCLAPPMPPSLDY